MSQSTVCSLLKHTIPLLSSLKPAQNLLINENNQARFKRTEAVEEDWEFYHSAISTIYIILVSQQYKWKGLWVRRISLWTIESS